MPKTPRLRLGWSSTAPRELLPARRIRKSPRSFFSANTIACRLFALRWSPLIAGALAIASATTAAEQSVTPVDEILIVDSVGHVLGKALDVEGQPGATLALAVDGKLAILHVARDRLIGTAESNVLFETPDCSGQPYISSSEVSLGPSLTAEVVAGRTGVLYFGDPGATPAQITIRSFIGPVPRSDGDCQPWGGPPPGPSDAIPVQALVALYDVFTPPFSLVAASTPTPGSATAAAPTTPTPTMPALPACCGDCDGSGVVTVDELITGVNRLLLGCIASHGIAAR